jgi:hypothetical protein
MEVQYSLNFLKREKYIRYAGILLILSPFGNFFWSSALSGIYHWWNPRVLALIIKGIPPVFLFLWGSAFVVGLTMLKGKRSSWNLTLGLLSLNLIFGIISFKKDIATGWFQPTISLTINAALFVLIYIQEFHQKLEARVWEARMNRPFSITLQSPVVLHFESCGNWAQITEIKNTGFKALCNAQNIPAQLETKTIEIVLTPELVLRARFSARSGQEIIFRFTNLTPASLTELQRWAGRWSTPLPLAA